MTCLPLGFSIFFEKNSKKGLRDDKIIRYIKQVSKLRQRKGDYGAYGLIPKRKVKQIRNGYRSIFKEEILW